MCHLITGKPYHNHMVARALAKHEKSTAQDSYLGVCNNLPVAMGYGTKFGGTQTVDLLTTKLLCNSVISAAPGDKFMMLDLKDFYLNNPMERPELLRMKNEPFLQNIIDHYNLKDKVDEKSILLYLERV